MWRSTRLNAHQSQSLTSVPTGVQSGSDLLQNTFHKTSSVCSWSDDSPNVSFPSQRSCHFHQLEILMSPLFTRRCNHSVGVAICLIRPAPLRIAIARPAVASSLISRLGLSTPSPNPFALTSTPCCCNITPTSRIVETRPIPAAAAFTAA